MNRINQLNEIESSWGVEVDLRSSVDSPGSIHLSHDPWNKGDDFEFWLKAFKKLEICGPLILNTKEDGLESRALLLLKEYGIENFFFLDTSFPTLVRWVFREKVRNFALRVSAFEPLESLRPFEGQAAWVWVDCFDGIPIDESIVEAICEKFKVCLVSPELQGINLENSPQLLTSFNRLLKHAHAICTKSPSRWKQPHG